MLKYLKITCLSVCSSLFLVHAPIVHALEARTFAQTSTSFGDGLGEKLGISDIDTATSPPGEFLEAVILDADSSGNFFGFGTFNPEPDTVLGVQAANLVWRQPRPNSYAAAGIITSFIQHSNEAGSNFSVNRVSTQHSAKSRLDLILEEVDDGTPFSLRYGVLAGDGNASATISFTGPGLILPLISANIQPGGQFGTITGVFDGGDYLLTLEAASSSTGRQNFQDIDTFASWDFSLLLGPGSTQNTAIGPSGPPGPGTNISSPDVTLIITSPASGPELMLAESDPFFFDDVDSGRWYDPVAANGFVYQMEDGALFTEIIDFADGFDNPFEVWAEGQSLGTFSEDESVDFVDLLGHGVSSFAVTGISPLVDAEDPLAFPIQLAFDTDTADFSQFALTAVPEPTSLALLAIGGSGLLFRRRRATHREFTEVATK